MRFISVKTSDATNLYQMFWIPRTNARFFCYQRTRATSNRRYWSLQ